MTSIRDERLRCHSVALDPYFKNTELLHELDSKFMNLARAWSWFAQEAVYVFLPPRVPAGAVYRLMDLCGQNRYRFMDINAVDIKPFLELLREDVVFIHDSRRIKVIR